MAARSVRVGRDSAISENDRKFVHSRYGTIQKGTFGRRLGQRRRSRYSGRSENDRGLRLLRHDRHNGRDGSEYAGRTRSVCRSGRRSRRTDRCRAGRHRGRCGETGDASLGGDYRRDGPPDPEVRGPACRDGSRDDRYVGRSLGRRVGRRGDIAPYFPAGGSRNAEYSGS